MKLLVATNREDFAEKASRIVVDRVAAEPELALTLPTGSTPRGLYQRLVGASAAGRFTLDQATVFMLDEYVDLPSYPEGSFVEYLRDNLGELLCNSRTNFQSLAPSVDPRVVVDYDRALDDAGGLDLVIIGVGRNGHVGFNEPGAPMNARTRVTELARETLDANFPSTPLNARPSHAITMGMADLASARSILMLVAGAGKSDVAALLLDGDVDAMVPATQLLGHPDLTIVVDAALDTRPHSSRTSRSSKGRRERAA